MILFEISREAFLPFLVFSFIIGVLLGPVYDIFRIRRKAVRRMKRMKLDFVLTFIEDILFSIFASVTLILVCYKLYFGIPRWYSYASAISGFFVWRITLGKLVMALSDKIIAGISVMLAFIRARLLAPIFRLINGTARRLSGKVALKRAISYTKAREKKLLRSLRG